VGVAEDEAGSMTDLLIAIGVPAAILAPIAAWLTWVHRRRLVALAADVALFPFVALGWLIGAGLYAIEMAYYAIMSGYERGRKKDQL
jgi:hypothetical protein